MPHNFERFRAALDREALATGRRAQKMIADGAVLELLRRVIPRTRVDTGSLLANHQVTVGSPATSVVSRTDRTGESTLQAARAALAAAGPFEERFLSNPKPQAVPLENGHARGDPPGNMYGISSAEVDVELRDVREPPQ